MKSTFSFLFQNPGIKARLFLMGITTILLVSIFGDVVFHPNRYLFGDGGDGLKTYYATAYYVKYNHGVQFTGMNYPYGEHIVFTDNQPIIATTLNWIDDYLFPISQHSVGIINLLMLLSILVCVLLLFEILHHYMLPPWFAMLAAIAIGCMSPQINRFTGHYALSYCTFVPLIWWLMILLLKSDRRKYLYSILLALSIIAFSFVTLYYGLLGAAILGCFAVLYWIKNGKKAIPTVIWLLVPAIMTFVVAKIFMGMTDPVEDRIVVPYGFFYYRASFESVFLPSYGPLYKMIKGAPWYTEVQGEGRAYIGLIGFLVLVWSIVKIVRYLLKRTFKRIIHPVLPHSLGLFVFASIPVLLFSMTIPFRWNLQDVFYSIPLLNQFRAIGRLAWIFYYIYAVYSSFVVYQLYRWLRVKGYLKGAYVMLMIVVGVYIYEDYIHIQRKLNPIVNHQSGAYFMREDFTQVLDEAGYKSDDFQAIFSVPFNSIGSEKLYISNGAALFQTFRLSYETGLPSTAVYMSRTSITQALLQAQLLSSPLIEKEILKDYKNDKPLLLLVPDEEVEPLERALIEKAEYIGASKKIKLYKLPLSAFEDEKQEAVNAFQTNRDSLYKTNEYFSSTPTQSVVYQTFYQDKNVPQFLNVEATKKLEGEQKLMLFNNVLPTDPTADSLKFTLSYWLYADKDSPALPNLTYKQSEGAQVVDEKMIYGAFHSTETYKNWVRYEMEFTLFHSENTVSLELSGRNIQVNELLIQPTNTDIYTRVKYDSNGALTSLVKNNYCLLRQAPN